MTIHVKNVDGVVLAACAIHNYLRRTVAKQYVPALYADWEDTNNATLVPGQWRDIGASMPLQQVPRPTNLVAKEVRDTYKRFFNNEGSTSFQDKMVFGET